MKILHPSDTHLDRAGGQDADGTDGTVALRRMLADLLHLRDLDALVVTGDVADGSREGYARASELVGDYAQERGTSVFFATGNHDERAAFSEVRGCGHVRPDAVYDGPEGEEVAASTVDGLRWSLLTPSCRARITEGSAGPSWTDWRRTWPPRGAWHALSRPGVGEPVPSGAGLGDVATEGDAVDDGRAEPEEP
ncbi:metallophosphoesterase family protein [Streptomyces canus]|uniref:metallophosphoesterase family protein n=1 Tax=Streptomyces canus TaxID=58343 RepID=UPI00386F80F2